MATITLQKRTFSPAHDTDRRRSEGHFLLQPQVMIIVLFVLVLMTCFFYLSQFNALSTQGVIINDLQRTRSQLIIKNEVWNMRIAKLKSLDVIQKQDVVKRMVSIDPSEIEFIDLDQRTAEEK